MIIELFEAKHYYTMPRRTTQGFEQYTTEDISFRLQLLEKNKTARTFIEDGKIYAIAGWVDLWDGVCEAFFVPSLHFPEKKKTILKYVRQEMSVLSKLYQRIQLTCVDQEFYRKFAAFFGFNYEGKLHCFDRFKRDHCMYSIVEGS